MSDANHLLPLKATEGIVNIIVQDRINNETARRYIKQLDKFYTVNHIRINPGTDSLTYANATELAKTAKAVIVTSYSQSLSSSGALKLSAQQQQFIHSLVGIVPKESPLILLSLGTPYIINYFPEISSYLCTYSPTEDCEELAVEVLRGELKPRGVLPVSLQGHSR